MALCKSGLAVGQNESFTLLHIHDHIVFFCGVYFSLHELYTVHNTPIAVEISINSSS